MNTFGLRHESELPASIRADGRLLYVEPWHVAVAVSVNADRNRLFQALTVPEYMEAWISIPGVGQDQQITATCLAERYCILACSGARLAACISGFYRVCRMRKLVFTWSTGTAANALPSLVTIRLLGDFARTTLRLSHSGLASKAEYLWHREFWECSLERLRALF
jgi:uncharacterized protein YndB with AHSA1/START domain